MSIATPVSDLRRMSAPPSADVATTVVRSRPDPPGGRRLFGPGWPLKLLFIGFPLWWVMGLSEPACFVAGLLMGLELLHRRQLAVPRAFVLWLLFLAFVLGGVALLQVDVVGAVPGSANTRYVTWAYRFGWYLTATILMLYIGNLRRELSTTGIARTISWMFVTLTAGGLLGVLVPEFQFQSLMELLLPGRVSGIAFVRDLIHPSVAQLYSSDGSLNPRPSAPFPYTNDWGVNYACLLPFFMATWFGKNAGWRRPLGPVIFLASLVPVVESQNRGLWLALVAMAVFLVIRSVAAGHLRLLVLVLGGSTLLVALVLLTPLSGALDAKLSGDAPSDTTRSNLGSATFDGVRETSPVVGVGTTRNVQGSFESIATGASASCPLCSPPSLGTQGQLWLVMFCQGFVGLCLYLGFFFSHFFRHLRLHTPYVTVGLCTLIAHFTTMPFYNTIGPAILFVMAAVGLMWRESVDARPSWDQEGARLPLPSVPRVVPILRRSWVILVCWALVGAALGIGWQVETNSQSVAKISVWLRNDPVYPDSTRRPETLDTAAQIASGARVLTAISDATGQSMPAVARSLTVSAVPNTRVLQLSVRAGDAKTATEAVTVAAQTVLSIRTEELSGRQQRTSRELRAKSRRLAGTVTKVQRAISRARGKGGIGPPRLLQTEQFDLEQQVDDAESSLATVSSLSVEPGEVVRGIRVKTVHDGWYIAVITGVMIGLMIGTAHVMSRDTGPRRTRPRLLSHRPAVDA